MAAAPGVTPISLAHLSDLKVRAIAWGLAAIAAVVATLFALGVISGGNYLASSMTASASALLCLAFALKCLRSYTAYKIACRGQQDQFQAFISSNDKTAVQKANELTSANGAALYTDKQRLHYLMRLWPTNWPLAR